MMDQYIHRECDNGKANATVYEIHRISTNGARPRDVRGHGHGLLTPGPQVARPSLHGGHTPVHP